MTHISVQVKPKVLPVTLPTPAIQGFSTTWSSCVSVSPSAAVPKLALLQSQWPLTLFLKWARLCPPKGLGVGCPLSLASSLRWSLFSFCHLLQTRTDLLVGPVSITLLQQQPAPQTSFLTFMTLPSYFSFSRNLSLSSI